MNWLQTMLVVGMAFLVVFLQAACNFPRPWLGVQVDLLPSLVVYASLAGGLALLTLVSVCGGFWFDSLSANPLGISVLPLFLAGWVIQRYRGLILREEAYAQWVLGLSASAAVPALTLLLLIHSGQEPLTGWFTLWQWLVLSLVGGAVTPVWFRLFGWVTGCLSYRPLRQTSFRLDREIKRGRS